MKAYDVTFPKADSFFNIISKRFFRARLDSCMKSKWTSQPKTKSVISCKVAENSNQTYTFLTIDALMVELFILLRK